VFLKLIEYLPIDVIIEGEAPGADTLGREFAIEYGIPVEPFPAQWNTHGKAAGPIRNQRMIDEGHPTCAVAFYDKPRSESRGTADMVRRLKKAGIVVEEIDG
jgi:hypothetical protein